MLLQSCAETDTRQPAAGATPAGAGAMHAVAGAAPACHKDLAAAILATQSSASHESHEAGCRSTQLKRSELEQVLARVAAGASIPH